MLLAILRSVQSPAGIAKGRVSRVHLSQHCWSACQSAVLVFTVIIAAILTSSATQAQQPTELAATVLDEANWDQLVPLGKEVDAIYGDFVLQNEFIRAVIANPVATRNANMTVRNVGGCLIDLATRSYESDQLSAFFPGRRAFAFTEPVSVESTSSGAKNVGVTSTKIPGKLEMSVSLSLASESRYLTMTTTWKNSTDRDAELVLEDDLRADGGKEDLQKSPNGKHELFWFQDVYWQQAYGIHAPGFLIRSNSNTRESVLVYEPTNGQPVVLKPGESFRLTRHIFVAQHLPGVWAEFDRSEGKGASIANVALKVTAQNVPVANARVTLSQGETNRGVVMTDSSGRIDVALPKGEWTAAVKVAGIEYAMQSISVSGDGEQTLSLNDYMPGTAKITIVDFEDRPIPAKVQFTGRGTTATPNFGPESAEFFVQNLAYTPNGQIVTPLAAGEYDVTISRGPEYNAEFTTLTIKAGQVSELTAKLARVVETPGWISADFHSHSTPSGDNTSSQKGRVLNLVAEHVEFAPCTEHNRISTYTDHINSLSLQTFLATVSGMELTGSPLPLNHQNVFPLVHRPRTQDGGAPVTDSNPETQFERIAAWDNNSVKLIQQNHPDIGWLFFDRDGNQNPDEGYSRSFGLMNVMEIHPIHPLIKPTQFEVNDGKPTGNQTCVNWLQLLNQGFRIYGVVNTDSHYNYHGSGGLRLWLKSSTDDPAKLDSDELRDVSRSGQIIMSNGPYLEASFAETDSAAPPVVSGQDLVAKSKKVTADIRVQCPNWLDIDTVFVLVNGRRQEGLEWTRESNPDMFGGSTDAVVKFERRVEIELKEDSHLIVVAGHRTQVIGDIMGPMWKNQNPTALTNPVFVDLQGDGFTANKDTLDFPLPVKFVAEDKK